MIPPMLYEDGDIFLRRNAKNFILETMMMFYIYIYIYKTHLLCLHRSICLKVHNLIGIKMFIFSVVSGLNHMVIYMIVIESLHGC
jgi:hypothetical protein